MQLKPRSVFTRARVQADVQRILDVYRRQGRFAATVEPKIIELEQNRVNLVFEINEGSATKVKGINFVGNRAFSDSQLRDIISTTQSGWFDFLKGTNVYDPDRLSLDRELLRQYYLKNGYADVQVIGGQRRARSRRLGLLHHLRRSRKASCTSSAASTSRARCRASSPSASSGELLTDAGRDLQRQPASTRRSRS